MLQDDSLDLITRESLLCNCTLKKGGRVAKSNMRENHTLVKVIALRNLIQRNRQRRKLLLVSIAPAILRRRRLVKLCITALFVTLNASRNRPVPHSCQYSQRDGGWWNVMRTTCTDARFKKTFIAHALFLVSKWHKSFVLLTITVIRSLFFHNSNFC